MLPELMNSLGEKVPWKATSSGHAFIIKKIPDYTTLVAQGKVWKAQDLTTTAVLTALPTTVSALTAQNPTPNLWYVVFAVTIIVDVAPVSLGSVGLSYCTHNLPVTDYTRDVALTVVNGLMGGQGAYNGQIILDRGATVVDNGWVPIGDSFSNVVNSQAWMQAERAFVAPVIIPPKMHISIGAQGNSATFEAGIGLIWAEVEAKELQ